MITEVIVASGKGSSRFTVEPVSTEVYDVKIVIDATPDPGYTFEKYVVKGRSIYEVFESGIYEETPFEEPYSAGPHIEVSEYDTEGHYESFRFARIVDRVEVYFAQSYTDSAINLTLVSNPVGVGNLTGGGLKSGAVGSSVVFDVLASVNAAQKAQYVFSHWIDDAGVRYNAKGFNKSFTLKSGYTTSSPEQKTFTAYFRRFTGLILRSATSGDILHGRANRILRDA